MKRNANSSAQGGSGAGAVGKRRFNAADVVILLVILCAVAAAIWLFAGSGLFGSEETVTLEYEIFVTQVRTEFASHISDNDTVIEGTKRFNIGNVNGKPLVEPYMAEVYVNDVYDENGNPVGGSTDGELVYSEMPGFINITLPVTASATVLSDGYSVNGFKLNVGTLVYFRLPDYCGAGYVTSVNVTGNGGN